MYLSIFVFYAVVLFWFRYSYIALLLLHLWWFYLWWCRCNGKGTPTLKKGFLSGIARYLMMIDDNKIKGINTCGYGHNNDDDHSDDKCRTCGRMWRCGFQRWPQQISAESVTSWMCRWMTMVIVFVNFKIPVWVGVPCGSVWSWFWPGRHSANLGEQRILENSRLGHHHLFDFLSIMHCTLS